MISEVPLGDFLRAGSTRGDLATMAPTPRNGQYVFHIIDRPCVRRDDLRTVGGRPVQDPAFRRSGGERRLRSDRRLRMSTTSRTRTVRRFRPTGCVSSQEARNRGALRRRGRRKFRRKPSIHDAPDGGANAALTPARYPTATFRFASSVYPKADWAPRFLRAKTTFQAMARDSVDAYADTMGFVREPLRREFSRDFHAGLNGYRAADVLAGMQSRHIPTIHWR